MIIGYEIIGQDNGKHMFDADDPNLQLCKKCGYVINFDYINPNFNIGRRNYDFSYTYDGRCIVSLKFKEFCLRNNYSGLEFIDLPNEVNFFYFKVKNIISIDTSLQNIVNENYCDQCGNYEGVVTKRPLYIKDVNKIMSDSFYATDIHLGGGNGKAPAIIIGIETYRKLNKEKIKGITFLKLES